MRKYSTPLPKQSRTFDATPKASQQAGWDVLLATQAIRSLGAHAVQRKEGAVAHLPIQKAPTEATIGGDWEMKGRSDSRIIYNTANKALGYWVKNEGRETKIYDTNVTLHHIIPVERLKKFWNKIKRNIGTLQTLSTNLVDIHMEQRGKEARELSLKRELYFFGRIPAKIDEKRRLLLQKESEITERIQHGQHLQTRLQSIQREMDRLSQKRPSKPKVSMAFEGLKSEKAEVRKELDRYKEDMEKLKLEKTLLLQRCNALNRKMEDFDRLREQGIEEMSSGDFLATKGVFSGLLETPFTSGSSILSAREVKQYIGGRTAVTKDNEKDQIIASLYLWLPGNLVPGPKENTRPNDGHEGFDLEAAEIQGNQTQIKALYDKIYDYTDGSNSTTYSNDMENDIIKDIQDILAKGKMNQNGLWIRLKNGNYVKGW